MPRDIPGTGSSVGIHHLAVENGAPRFRGDIEPLNHAWVVTIAVGDGLLKLGSRVGQSFLVGSCKARKLLEEATAIQVLALELQPEWCMACVRLQRCPSIARQLDAKEGLLLRGLKVCREEAACCFPFIFLLPPPPHPLATFSILWLEYYHSDILLAIHIE